MHRTNPLIHRNSPFQYTNTKLTSLYYMNYSYIIQPNYCKGTLCNFDPIKNYFLFSPLYAKINCALFVPIEYLQCVEGGATKCMYGNTFNLLSRDWITDKLDNREPSAEETQILNHLLALPSSTLQLRPLPSCPCSLPGTWSRIFGILQGSWQSGPWFRVRISDVGQSPSTSGSQSLKNYRLTVLAKALKTLSFSYFLFLFLYITNYFLYPFLLCHNWKLGSVLFFSLLVGVY